MPDTLITPHPELPRFARWFFEHQSRPASEGGFGRGMDGLWNLKILAGVYAAHAGGPLSTAWSVSLTPRFTLRVARTMMPLEGGQPALTGVSLAEGDWVAHPLYYLAELGDAVTDDAATLRRLLAHHPQGTAWADAIAGDADRATRFARSLRQMDSVPAGSPSDVPAALVSVLARHFTYGGQEGARFAKWGGSGRNFPADADPAYLARAVSEVRLRRDRIYVYGVCAARLRDPAAPADAMFEFLATFSVDGDGAPTGLTVVYAAPRPPAATTYNQFCFFYAHDGVGVAVPETARTTLPSSVVRFLDGAPADDIRQYVTQHPGFAATRDGRLRLLGTVRTGATLTDLPQGVEVLPVIDDAEGIAGATAPTGEDDDDAVLDARGARVRVFLAPPAQVAALAAREEVVSLREPGRAWPRLDRAATRLRHAQLLTKLHAEEGGGEDVVVGVIDTGIDATHPAFAGRVKAVWDMTQTDASIGEALDNPHPAVDYGRIYRTAADLAAHATDPGGHGTHVSGIAAGATATGYPYAGMASKAHLVVVKLRDWTSDEYLYGAKWIFAEAARINAKACIVNMSLGSHEDHGHDGLDDHPGLALRGLLRRPGGQWRPGRLICAAAGNERTDRMHSHVDSLAPGAEHTFRVFVRDFSVQPHRINVYARPIPANVRGCTVEIRVTEPGGTGTGYLGPQPDAAPRGGPHGGEHLLSITRVQVSNGPPQPYSRHARPSVELGGDRVLSGSSTLVDSGVGQIVVPGTWEVRIKNTSTVAIEVHAYGPEFIVNDNVFFLDATEKTLLLSPAASHGIVAVAATVNRTTWRAQGATSDTTNQNREWDMATAGHPLHLVNERAEDEIAGFSCPGPVRGSRVGRIEALAPGSGIISAMSAQFLASTDPGDVSDRAENQISNLAICWGGTSMASPMIAGLAACLFSKDPTLTFASFVQKVDAASTVPCRPDPATGTRPTDCPANLRDNPDDWGPGRLDASKLVP